MPPSSRARPSAKGAEFLSFRCTGCGNCCKEPLLPLTDADAKRIARRTGDRPSEFIRWVDKDGIDMDDEPEAFVTLRQGKRVMVLRHENGGCRYLGGDNRCTIYTSRPLGCRVYPFDPDFTKDGNLKRLKIVKATECPHEMDGENDAETLRELDGKYQQAHWDYNDKVAEWNREQQSRKRAGKAARTASEFLAFLGLE
jgi:Fe-S-cluster containining protein